MAHYLHFFCIIHYEALTNPSILFLLSPDLLIYHVFSLIAVWCSSIDPALLIITVFAILL